jgi:quinol-cytochrome oxidoreductase complex cytochrome b subunit
VQTSYTFNEIAFSSESKNKVHRVLIFCFITVFITLGYIGACPVAEPYITVGQLFTFFYFFILILLAA